MISSTSSGATATTATVSTTPCWGRLGTTPSPISTAVGLSPCQTGMSTCRLSPNYIYWYLSAGRRLSRQSLCLVRSAATSPPSRAAPRRPSPCTRPAAWRCWPSSSGTTWWRWSSPACQWWSSRWAELCYRVNLWSTCSSRFSVSVSLVVWRGRFKCNTGNIKPIHKIHLS